MMKNNLVQLHIVYGPTASGKTDLAINLANKFNGELISADSRQIYKYMDIGTNKEISRLTNNDNQWLIDSIPIHMINIITPDKSYSVAEYQKAVYKIIEDIRNRDKTPIWVGGTGLYIDSVVKRYKLSEQNIDQNLRDELSSLTVEELQHRLNELNPKQLTKMNESDRANPRRLIRAIEKSYPTINQILKTNIRAQDPEPRIENEFQQSPFQTTWHPTQYERTSLMDKINTRVIKMVDEGLVEETQKLIEMGYNYSLPAMNTMGYKEAGEYLRKKITKEEMIGNIQQAHRNYAKRQITWFKKYGKI